METFSGFTNLYPLSKTLRFRLIPVGETLKHFIDSGILEEDQHRAESYVKVKAIIDDYHRAYIENSLSGFELPLESTGKFNSLEEYYLYHNIRNKTEEIQNLSSKVRTNLRKQVVAQLTKNEIFKRIDKKELIQSDLIDFVKNEPDANEKIALISEFRNFTVYFKGFHENRRNMYSDEEKSTSIAFRLIHENLPKFIDNMEVFAKIQNTSISENFDAIQKELCPELVTLCEMFKLGYFNKTLSQKQIDAYNTVIGGKTTSEGKKIKGLNEYINLYNQQHKQEKLPKMKLLFKQILSDRESASWLPEKFENDSQVVGAIVNFWNTIHDTVLAEGGLKTIIASLGSYGLEGIFLKNDLQLTDISQKATGSWGKISSEIKQKIEVMNPQKKKESYETYQERIDKIFKSYKSFSLAFINECLRGEYKIEDYFLKLGAVNSSSLQKENHFSHILNTYTDVKEVIGLYSESTDTKLIQDNDSIQKIKQFLDAVKDLQAYVKPLLGNGDETGKDERFYGDLIEYWSLLDLITPLYNMVRNYVTQKPYSVDKIKINFQNPTLLNGWDLNKETDNTSVILRRDGKYYLAIMNNKSRKVFLKYPSGTDRNCYEKMEYKLLPGANKMLPKVFFSKSRINEFMPNERLLSNYEKGTHKKSGTCFSLDDCHTLIDFFKKSLDKHEDWKNFGFKFSDTSTYEDMSGFYKEVENQGYKLSFKPIDATYVDQLVDEGKIFLFQIYNKDFSEHSKGTPNMHTLYWKMLFDETNLGDVVYKLNGEAEVFFRKASINVSHPTHPANIPIKKKNLKHKDEERILKYDLIKDKRYTVDQFQFHVPITMNFKADGNGNINQKAIDYLRSASDTHIIGIDRGERNLLYLVVIDGNGKICEQFSLNEIEVEYNGENYSTNYHDLLNVKENERKQARQSWQSIANIKDLKEGYLSQVIHKISELMVKYNAIVVLEDLNAGFMRGRQKVEKQVYQKFEKKLIEKLNYLVFKKQSSDLPGGLMHAYQLANKFESFNTLGKQSGFLFYIPAWNTSKMDPVTGFVNLFDVKYESVDKAKSFFSKFDSIRYNVERDMFEWKFNYGEFTKKAEGTKTDWTVCSYGNRIITFRNPDKNSQWDNKEINLTENIKLLFERFGIDLSSNLKDEIMQRTEKEFFIELISLFKLVLQMRNSWTGTDIDYLVSPVCNENGEFFDSRNVDETLPQNADANGAYNIARKGMILLDKIKKSNGEKKLALSITNREWLSFAQGCCKNG